MRILCLVDLLGAAKNQDFSEDLKSIEWKTEANVLAVLKKQGHDAKVFGVASDVWPLLNEIRSFRPDIVFNLCEAFAGDRSLESSIPSLLTMLGVPFTGCSAQVLSFCKDKHVLKSIAAQAGVRLAKSILIRQNEKIPAVGVDFFPAFVKASALESSQGLSMKSKVTNAAQLAERVQHLQKNYRQDVLVEEYIDGRELYVSALCRDGKIVKLFAPRELHFGALAKTGQGFATYRSKWDEDYRKKWNIHSRPARNLKLCTVAEMQESTRKLCRALQITGYIRLDFRAASKSDEPYFLEINPNPALARDDEFALSAKASGVTYSQLISEILELCLTKSAKRRASNRRLSRLAESSTVF